MFLVLDFTQSLSFALAGNNSFITKALKTKKNISEILIFEIEKFLKKTKVNIKKIKSIYIITGPGSFTGIRSAITFAKSLKLIMKLNIFGLSKFQIINSKIKLNKFNKTRCIFLYFKNKQLFSQTFKGYKATNEARLINLDKEKLKFNNEITYIYDNILLESSLGSEFFKRKDNSHFVDYNFKEINELITNNMIDNTDPKPLYISSYY